MNHQKSSMEYVQKSPADHDDDALTPKPSTFDEFPERDRFTSVRFHNFKAFKSFSISLHAFNVLVGPNNSGKSTIIGAFRILFEGMRKAATRSPEYVSGPNGGTWGYRIPLEDLPVATENVFHDYDDKHAATVDFRLSSGKELQLYFRSVKEGLLICRTQGRPVRTPKEFREAYNANIGFVPVLGPVEHKEPLYQKKAARLALLTHRASRNFRNIWFHYPEDFAEFRKMVRDTWLGMDIEPPEVDQSDTPFMLYMFSPEERMTRELFWSGFGFQVWCQMLTFMVKFRSASLFIIDEPDIYLHSDLQRQLVGLLKELGPDILLATHSTEIISEAEPADLLAINKKTPSATRMSNPSQLQALFGVLGSNLNPTLTQLAKSRRVVFVEGKDFQVLSLFAKKLGKAQVANRSDFAVVPVEGFNAPKVRDFSEGMELTLGAAIAKAIVFDRDYRSDAEVSEVHDSLRNVASFVWIHRRKELENYLLDPKAITRAVEKRLEEKLKRTGEAIHGDIDIKAELEQITEGIKNDICGQYLAKRSSYEQTKNRHHDPATIHACVLGEFNQLWGNFASRIAIVPGKQVLSLLNRLLQEKYGITITPNSIISCLKKEEVPEDMVQLMTGLEAFRVTIVQ